jgi:glucose-1-phosphate adenylyltransferase
MRKAIALVLAGGRIEGYGVLTLNRAKAALPFAGFYRIVDFALSSLSRSRIEGVGLICQYLPASLIEHVHGGAPWGLDGFGRDLRIMPPFVGVGKIEWFRGTADAIYQNLNFVYDWGPSYVIICSAEHVYSLDFANLLTHHESTGADLTIVEKKMPADALSKRFGYVVSDESGRVTDFIEKPATPPTDRISIGIYVFNKDVLVERLERLGQGDKSFNLAREIIPPMIKTHRVVRYPFEGYWNYLETVEDYYLANMSLLRDSPAIDLEGWEVLTNLDDRALARRSSACFGPSADVRDSLVSPACQIDGVVENSILSPGVVVERGAVVRDSILMHDIRVERDARLSRVVADKDVVFGRGTVMGIEREAHNGDKCLQLTLVGKGFKLSAESSQQWVSKMANRH